MQITVSGSRARRTYRRVGVAAFVAATLTLTACGGSDDKTSGPTKAPSASVGADVKCDATQVGPFTRCENFYTDYWPIIEANMQELYKEALETDDGNLVVWDWDAPNEEQIALFNEKYPDLKVEADGFEENLQSAIISAEATGARNTDLVNGQLSNMGTTYDQGFWEKVDWSQYGVPEEFLEIGGADTGLLPDSYGGFFLGYNTTEIDSVPDNLDALLDPEWEGKVAIDFYLSVFFTGYGLEHGEDKMVELIEKLKSSGTLDVVSNADSLLSTGDRPVALQFQFGSENPALKVAPFDDMLLFTTFTGVNAHAQNSPGARLWALWNAYDPDFLAKKMTDPAFVTSPPPYAGLPSSLFSEATGVMKVNVEGWTEAMTNDLYVLETWENREEAQALAAAADAALNE